MEHSYYVWFVQTVTQLVTEHGDLFLSLGLNLFKGFATILIASTILGTSENAVRIQIAVALIAFVLLRLAQAAQKAVPRPLDFARLVRTNLMHRRPLDRLLEPPRPITANRNQLSLALYFQ